MKKLLFVAMLSLLSVSCLKLDGNLQVHEKITLKKKGGFLNLKRINVDIEANSYQAGLKVISKDNFTLSLHRGDDKILIPLKAKEEIKIPTFDGEFRVSGSKVEQPYDLVGRIQTDISHGPTQEAIEACTWETRETRCRVECRDVVTKDERGVERRENKCDKICEDVLITHHGRKEVIFHYKTTYRELDLSFVKENTNHEVAKFDGSDTQVEKVVTRSGICN